MTPLIYINCLPGSVPNDERGGASEDPASEKHGPVGQAAFVLLIGCHCGHHDRWMLARKACA